MKMKSSYRAVLKKSEKGWIGEIIRKSGNENFPVRTTQNHANQELAITALNKLIDAYKENNGVKLRKVPQIKTF